VESPEEYHFLGCGWSSGDWLLGHKRCVFGDNSGVGGGMDHGGQVGEGWCRCDESILAAKHFPCQRRLSGG